MLFVHVSERMLHDLVTESRKQVEGTDCDYSSVRPCPSSKIHCGVFRGLMQ